MSGVDGTAEELKELFPARSRRQVLYNLSGLSFYVSGEKWHCVIRAYVFHEKTLVRKNSKSACRQNNVRQW